MKSPLSRSAGASRPARIRSPSLVSLRYRSDLQHESVAIDDPYRLPGFQWNRAHHAPLLAVNTRPAFALDIVLHDTDAADQLLAAGHDGAPPRLESEPGHQRHEH